MDPLISVVVPVYQVAAYLDPCVESIVAQTYRQLEIILVDDGSTDGSGALCDRWAKRDPRIRVIHQSNQGLSMARNAGIDAASGPLLAFVDSDDLLHPTCYEKLYRVMVEYGVPLVQCDFFPFENPQELPAPPDQPECTQMDRDTVFRGITEELVVAWNKLYKTELFRQIRYPAGRRHEDEFAAHRLFWEAERLAWIHEPLYFYRQRPGSITAGTVDLHTLDSLDAMRDRIDFCLSVGRPDLAVWSMDTLLANTEKLYFRKKEFPPDVWKIFCAGISADARRWRGLENTGQKRRWFWLRTTPEQCQRALKRQQKKERWLIPLKNKLKPRG